MKIFKGPKKLSKCFICENLYFLYDGMGKYKTVKCWKNKKCSLSVPGKRLCVDFKFREQLKNTTNLKKRYSISELFSNIQIVSPIRM